MNQGLPTYVIVVVVVLVIVVLAALVIFAYCLARRGKYYYVLFSVKSKLNVSRTRTRSVEKSFSN